MFKAMGAPASMRNAIEAQETDVYPENMLPLQAFGELQTQWRSGMGGREGMIYSEIWKWMDEQRIIKRKRRQDLMRCLRVMEAEALRVWSARQPAT